MEKLISFYTHRFFFSIFRFSAFFLMLLVNLILEFLVYLLKKQKLIVLDDISSNEYRKLRIRNDKIYEIINFLNKISKILDKEMFPFSWTINIVIKTKKILENQYKQNSKIFSSLSDKKKYYKGFERLSEEEIWNDRAKKYEYLI